MNALAPLKTSPMAALVRREFWEHRSLWITPLVVAGLLLFGVIASIVLGHGSMYFDHGVVRPTTQAGLAIGILSFTAPQYIVMLINVFFYLLDCLYTERKDRSILFWKSMPVSDTATVLSKTLVALVIVPIGVFLLTVLTDLVVAAIVAVSVQGGSEFWDTATWIKFRAVMVPGLAILLLWYTPIAGYLLLVSAWARRNVFLWAALPPFLLAMIESRTTGTHYIAYFLQYRLTGVWRYFATEESFSAWRNGVPPIGSLFETVGATSALSDADLWLGIGAAALLLFGAIRIRRYRDDT